MAEDLKKMYRTIMDDHFPDSMTIRFGEQEWSIGNVPGNFPMRRAVS